MGLFDGLSSFNPFGGGGGLFGGGMPFGGLGGGFGNGFQGGVFGGAPSPFGSGGLFGGAHSWGNPAPTPNPGAAQAWGAGWNWGNPGNNQGGNFWWPTNPGPAAPGIGGVAGAVGGPSAPVGGSVGNVAGAPIQGQGPIPFIDPNPPVMAYNPRAMSGPGAQTNSFIPRQVAAPNVNSMVGTETRMAGGIGTGGPFGQRQQIRTRMQGGPGQWQNQVMPGAAWPNPPQQPYDPMRNRLG
jgi:hypothetical protein